MHPAPSIILFTTASGLGFGIMALMGVGLGPEGAVAGPLTALIALALVAGGLMASAFHLGNPQRALLAFTQWRSSWLSREGCVSSVAMALFFVYAAHWALTGAPLHALGWLSSALAVLAVICTAMIYAQLKTVPRWSNALTAPMFLGAALAGGVISISLAEVLAGETPPLGLGFALLAASAAVHFYRRASRGITLESAGSSPESATGLGALGRVRLLEAPHSQPNYLMKEMVFAVGRKHAEKLGLVSGVGGLFAPLFLFILCRDPSAYGLPAVFGPIGLSLALMLHIGGALVSRWLFFAEAEHVVGLYYGRR
ncbi:dimethyl sulfoxide reductase anchor subunit [Pikeienuella piscinae]|uniref:Dimethyl sulfoxide reductase anchor subunit n=1 Tax=Pikeienuella piscinae TaxID=2748098 RepID=A0A7M3T5B9_9RHOB|nr:DmsC/YnfH family molybdoenzyme membrane anchor subunit [Pikeienuella piscinae]QIE57200.1 dimethyl sulfoxide reductase anchor subunit [Pikeienuella piscinae]